MGLVICWREHPKKSARKFGKSHVMVEAIGPGNHEFEVFSVTLTTLTIQFELEGPTVTPSCPILGPTKAGQ